MKDKNGNIIQKLEKNIEEIRNNKGKIIDYKLIES